MTSAPRPADGPLRVLVVCTGNVGRSPAAAVRLAGALGPDSGVEIASAGLRARVGEPLDPHMATVLGVPLPGFAARQVTAELVAAADLVVGMTRAHRAALVTLAPAAVRRTTTLVELAELAVLADGAGLLPADGSPAARLAGVLAAAPRLRGRRSAGPHEDVVDPYGRPVAEHRRAMAQIDQGLAALVPVLLGTAPGPGPSAPR